jgi:hypothetical protein
MKKNFAGYQPYIFDVLTAQDLKTEINPSIINSEDIFKPNPLENFSSDSPKKGNFRCFDDYGGYGYGNNLVDDNNSGGGGGFRDWFNIGLDVIKTGAGIWSQSEQNKANVEQAQKAEEIARLKLEQERLEKQQQEQKSTTFRRYGVPLIIGGGILVAGLTIFIILRRDK